MGNSISCSEIDSTFLFGLTIGKTYYVRVYTTVTTPNQNSTYDICITTLPKAPINDECISAIDVPVNSSDTCVQIVSCTIESATNSGILNTCIGSTNDDVWYQFTAISTIHTVSLENVIGGTNKLNFTIFEGTCDSLGAPIKCNSDLSSKLWELTIGKTYFLQVYSLGYTNDQNTTFDVCISSPIIPTNDECINAEVLSVIPDLSITPVTSGTLLNATESLQSNACGSLRDDDDVWYSFTATQSLHRINLLNIRGSNSRLSYAVYDNAPC